MFSRKITDSKRQTESLSFRLDKSDLMQLRALAGERKLSLNSLVSQILDRYLRLWLYDQAFGFFAVNSKVIRLAFNDLDDKKIEEIGHVGAEVHKKIIVYLYGKVNKTTVLNYLPIFCSRFDSYKHHVEGSVHTIAVFQEINVQFSKSYYKI